MSDLAGAAVSAVTKLRKVVGIETKAECELRISQLGHGAARLFEIVTRRIGQLQNTPVTIAQHLGIERVEIGVDFSEIDRLLDALEQELVSAPKASFLMEGSMHELAAWQVQLRGVVQAAAPYRRFPGSEAVP